MEQQQHNTAALNDIAGVLPMDTGVTVNGVHDENEKKSSSTANAGGKKGRGRPPKSPGSTKVNTVNSATPKRARGRPAKVAEPTATLKKVVVVKETKEVAPINGDSNQKKRGRPSKVSTPHEQINGISKPQVQPIPVSNHQEQDSGVEQIKKKRGRPSGTSPKKAVVSTPKDSSSKGKRGRPSGSASGKKIVSKPKVVASNDGPARKRGRPKKAAASPVAIATSTSVNESTATVAPTNIH